MKLCVVIPCYNEGKRLRSDVFDEFISKRSIHFLFVNDGSTDNTQELIKKLVVKHSSKVRAYSMPQNRGKAEAVRTGMNLVAEEDYDFIGFLDSDLATPLYELENMSNFLDNNKHLDMIMGIRIKRLGSKVDRDLSRHYLGRIFATFVSKMLGLPVYDTQCGAKLISSSLVKEVCHKPFQSAWFFDVELLMRIKNLKGIEFTLNRIYEYPLFEWKEIGGSNIKLKHYLMAPLELLKIKLRS